MRSNKLRELIKKGKPSIGIRMIVSSPEIIEIFGYTGMIDYVEFVGEYASWDLHDLENIARATELFDMSSMMKVDQNNKAFIAQRSLGVGIQNILFTDLRSVEDVKECVKIVKPETPEDKGINGCHMRRSVGYLIEDGSKEYVKAIRDSVIAIMIEKKDAVINLEEILSQDGIDMIQFGPGDYSMSLGIPGEGSHPKVKEAEIEAIKMAIKKGIRPRVELDFSVKYCLKSIKEYIQMGVIDFHLPSDLNIIFDWAKENGNELRKMLIHSA